MGDLAGEEGEGGWDVGDDDLELPADLVREEEEVEEEGEQEKERECDREQGREGRCGREG